MTIIYRLTLVCLLLGVLFNADAQVTLANPIPFKLPQSPNAASLGKYSEIPVNLNSGQVSPVIELYSFSIDGVSVPVNLSYQNSGLKVMDIPGWCGLGWDLNFGGMISHSVKGLPDESPVGMLRYFPREQQIKAFKNQMTKVERYNYFKSVYEGEIDSEYDQFTYSYPGGSGKFYINSQGKCVTQPRADIRITYVYDSVANSLGGFTIIDEAGNKYQFEAGEFSSSSDPAATQFSNFYNTYNSGTFYLTKITTHSQRVIEFTYSSNSLKYKDQVQSYQSFDVSDPNTVCRGQSLLGLNELEIIQGTKLLETITWDGGRIEFASDSLRKDLPLLDTSIKSPVLNGMKVFNKSNILIKNVQFQYGYFNGVARLKLQRVNIHKLDGAVDNSYQFSYYDEHKVPSLARPNNSQDFWGYYNGAGNQILPKVSLLSQFYGRTQSTGYISPDRASHQDAKAGMLQEIVYPTGGKTVFEYEPNTVLYKQQADIPISMRDQINTGQFQTVMDTIAFSNSQAAGGNYVNHDFTVPFVLTAQTRIKITAYYFNTDISGFGNCDAWVSGLTCVMSETGCTTFNETSTGRIVTATYLLDPGSYQGVLSTSAHDNYVSNARLVVEKFVTNNTTNYEIAVGGYRISRMINYDSVGHRYFKNYRYPLDTANTTFNANLRISPDVVTSTSKIQNSTENPFLCFTCNTVYTVSSSDVKNFEGFHIEYPKVIEVDGENGGNGKTEHFFTSTQRIGGGNFPFASPMHLDWLGGLESTTEIFESLPGSDSSRLLKRLAKSYSNPTDMTDTLNYNLKVGVSQYDGCLGYPNIFFTENDAAYALNSFTTEFIPNITQKFNSAGTSNLDRHYYFNNSYADKITSELAAYNNSAYRLTSRVETVDAKGDTIRKYMRYATDYNSSNTIIAKLKAAGNISIPIEQYLTKKSAGGAEYVTGGLFTLYNNDTRPLPSTVFYLNLSEPILLSSFVESHVDGGGNFVKDSRYQEQLTYGVYDTKGNILEQQKAADVKEVYLWGYNSVYPVAKIVGSDYSTASQQINQPILDVPSSDQALRIELAKLRNNLPDAQVTTFTYKPLVGKTSEVDPRGKASYYEYDSLGRLSIVRDQDSNVVRRICYNFAGKPENCLPLPVYTNDEISRIFYRQNCPEGYIGSMVTYTVPAGIFTSNIGKEDANQQAQNNATANGQAYANSNGTCGQYVAITLDLSIIGGGSYPEVTVDVLAPDNTVVLSASFDPLLSPTIEIPSGTYKFRLTKSSTGRAVNFSLTPGDLAWSQTAQVTQTTTELLVFVDTESYTLSAIIQ